VEPKLPSAWNGYRLKYRAGGVDYRISVARGAEGWETEIRKSEKD
jgi:cellobiose phosphorylase